MQLMINSKFRHLSFVILQELTSCQKHVVMDANGARNDQTEAKSRKDVRIIRLNHENSDEV